MQSEHNPGLRELRDDFPTTVFKLKQSFDIRSVKAGLHFECSLADKARQGQSGRSSVEEVFAAIPPVSFELDEELTNVFFPKSSVTPGTDAVCPYYSSVTPPPDCIDMHIELASYLACC